MAGPRNPKFTIDGREFPAYGILAVNQTSETHVQIRYASGRHASVRGTTSEVLRLAQKAKEEPGTDSA